MLPAVVIKPSTIPGRFIVIEQFGKERKRKVATFARAKEIADGFYTDIIRGLSENYYES